eukprot:874200-Pelagomonas_calceolata.AAC.2
MLIKTPGPHSPQLAVMLDSRFCHDFQAGSYALGAFMMVLASFGATVGALAVCAAALVNTSGKAVLLMNLVLLLWVLLGGFLVNSDSMPKWISWLRYPTPLPYAFEACMSNELKGQAFDIAVSFSLCLLSNSVLLLYGFAMKSQLQN